MSEKSKLKESVFNLFKKRIKHIEKEHNFKMLAEVKRCIAIPLTIEITINLIKHTAKVEGFELDQEKVCNFATECANYVAEKLGVVIDKSAELATFTKDTQILN